MRGTADVRRSPVRSGFDQADKNTPATKEHGTVQLKRVNVGCGQTPTLGWLNYDNSLSVLLAGHPFLSFFLDKIHALKPETGGFISVAQKRGILWTDATRGIPLADNSASVVYTSHMLPELSRTETILFLREAHRVLTVGGIIRVAVPDLQKMIDQYIVQGDADSFVEWALLFQEKPNSLIDRLKYLLIGERHRIFWIYDGPSLCRLLVKSGFRNPCILKPGATKIPHPGELNLFERASESVYVEALK